eukprot:TRINITY_DN6862_c0_g1_i1.p1 TRINITY_DN6862_c0_g1~~TRINITY_DN6862_c0_g1_i1.p1  ORF type:complete len:343 (+),score=28.39 TRINITY_DN6862_c0_g1_i1:33-1061(+)
MRVHSQAVNKKNDKDKTDKECFGCLHRYPKNAAGLSCLADHFLCDQGGCATHFVNQLFGDQPLGLFDLTPGSFGIKCATCRALYNMPDIEARLTTPELQKQFAELIALYGGAVEGCVPISCLSCKETYYMLDGEIDVLLQCSFQSCGKYSCLLCKQVVAPNAQRSLLTHVSGDDCCSAMWPRYQLVMRALENGGTRTCPGCGLRGRKNLNCTHITCARCKIEWCYMCSRKADDCDKAPGTATLMGHQVDWPTNPLRCPMYLNELSSVDQSFDWNSAAALDEFHRSITLALLQRVCTGDAADSSAVLYANHPAVFQGFTLDQIGEFTMPTVLERALATRTGNE